MRFILATLMLLSCPAYSFAGNCANGKCNVKVLKPVVVVTKKVVKLPQSLPCVNGQCKLRK